MKKRNYLFLIISILSLSSCVKSNPFEVNGLAIINEQEALYVSSIATSNLTNASKITVDKTSKIDKRKVYSGAAKQYAEYQSTKINSETVFYNNYGYSSTSNIYYMVGNGLDGSYYSEYQIEKDEWIDVIKDEFDSYYLFSNLNIKNPNSSLENIKTNNSKYFSDTMNLDIDWRQYILSILEDGYSYSDYSYGTKDNKLYAFYQTVNEGLITNPLHPEKQVIIFNEIMRVRSFKKDARLGWVIDYSAEKNNIYHVTSLTGSIYESPILVEENETIMNYFYENKKSMNFSYVQNEAKIINTPYLVTYDVNSSDDSLIEIDRTRLNTPYVSIYNSEYTLAISYFDIKDEYIYSLLINDGENEIKYGFPYFTLNELNIIYNDLSVENKDDYFKARFDTKLLLIMKFDRSGYIVDLQTIFLSANNIL